MDLPGGHKLTAGAGADGRLGIDFDDELFERVGTWEAEEVQECICAYLAIRWAHWFGEATGA